MPRTYNSVEPFQLVVSQCQFFYLKFHIDCSACLKRSHYINYRVILSWGQDTFHFVLRGFNCTPECCFFIQHNTMYSFTIHVIIRSQYFFNDNAYVHLATCWPITTREICRRNGCVWAVTGSRPF